jgi:sRNA-binding protein
VAHRHTPGSVVGKVTQAVGGASYARQRLAASRSLTNSRNATRGTGSRSAANAAPAVPVPGQRAPRRPPRSARAPRRKHRRPTRRGAGRPPHGAH